MLLDFDEAHTEIWSVDCQHSAENGVLVQVAGSLQCKVLNMAASDVGICDSCFNAIYLSVITGV